VRNTPQGTAQVTAPVGVSSRWSARFFLIWMAILAGLELLVQSGAERSLFLPAPSTVAVSLGRMLVDGSLGTNLVATLGRIALGLLIGAGLGVLLGLAMGTSKRLRRIVDPLVAAIHPIPRLAFFPLLIVVLGVGETSKLAGVALGAFFPMLLNTVAGVRGLNPVHLEIARNYGANRGQMFLHVVEIEVITDVPIEVAVAWVPWITFVATPHLFGGFHVTAEYCEAPLGQDGCEKSVARFWGGV